MLMSGEPSWLAIRMQKSPVGEQNEERAAAGAGSMSATATSAPRARPVLLEAVRVTARLSLPAPGRSKRALLHAAQGQRQEDLEAFLVDVVAGTVDRAEPGHVLPVIPRSRQQSSGAPPAAGGVDVGPPDGEVEPGERARQLFGVEAQRCREAAAEVAQRPGDRACG